MYLNIFFEAGSESSPQSYIHIWDDGPNGYKRVPYSKYAYKLDANGDYTTLYNQPCKLVKRWKKEDLENGLIFESDVHPEMRYLVDNYGSSEEPSKAHITMNFDIEVSTDGGLPDIHKAMNAITSIAYYDSAVKEYTVHLLDPNMQMNDLTMVQRGDNVHVFRYTTEEELLDAFLTEYESIRPTILTGWNCVSLNTNVWKENEIINIAELQYNDILFDSKINTILPTSIKKSNKIVLTTGQYIYASKEHVFPIVIKEKNKYTNFTSGNGIIHADKSISEIIKLNSNINNEIYFKVPVGKNNNTVKNDLDINNEVFYILGLLYTDGCKSGKTCCIYNSNSDIINSCFNFKESYKRRNCEGDGICTDSRSNTSETSRVKFWLSKYNPLINVIDYIYNENDKKEINLNKLSKISPTQFQYFLSGIIDGDGCLSGEHITFCNYNNDTDIYKLQELILWNGYISTVHNNTLLIPKKQKNIKIPLYLKSIYKKEIYDKIEFTNSTSKSNKIKYRFNDLENCFYIKLDKIIETKSVEKMIDINTDTHYFIGNSIKTHNCDNFDVSYLYNRLKNVFDDKTAKRLSPIGRIYYNKFQEKYFIAGVSCLDMMKLYKNFTFGQRSSYSLDAIGKLEVKEGKIQYSGTLDKLYAEDKGKFIDYNVHDVRLVKMIDDKMKLIELAKGICHKGHVPLEDFQFSSRFLDGAILTYLKRKGKIVVPNKPVKEGNYQHSDDPKFDGAYVKDPIPGMYHWLVDLDATSMYPSIIMTLNISPESKVAKLENWSNSDFQKGIEKQYKIALGDKSIEFDKTEFGKFIEQENLGISSNGVLYELTNKGIIPEILEVWFNERTEMKKLVKKHGKELNSDGSVNIHYDKNKLEFYNTRQKIQKTLLNSLYGVLGLQSFRYYDLDNAEAVTFTGVDLIKFAQSVTNLYYEKTLNKKDDYIIYTDTDSIFFSVEKLVRAKYPNVDVNDDNQMVDAILKIAHDIQVYVNKSMDYFAERLLGVKSHKFNMKQEIIAKSGIWTTKKRYALWAINIEGRPVDELEVKGLDSVRTSFPKVFRDFMTKMLKDILMAKPKEYIDSAILDLKQHIDDVDILDIARPTSIKEISKFCDNTHQPFNFTLKGTPAHVKAAINYNDFLRYHNLDSKFAFIGDGEKIKWLYMEPDNPFRLDALAFKDNDEDPKEIIDYIEKHIDRSKVFDSEMEKKLHDFYVALGWGNIPTKVYQEHSKFF